MTCVQISHVLVNWYKGDKRQKHVAWWLGQWISNPWVPGPKPMVGSKIDFAFYPSKVDHMSTGKFWGLNGKK